MSILSQTLGKILKTFSSVESGKAAAPNRSRFRARLTLEALDLRLPPSSIVGDGTDGTIVVPPDNNSSAMTASSADDGSTDGPTQTTPVATGPEIINFQATQISGDLWTFSGTVVDPSPAGLTVRFGGVPDSLQGKTATTDANGNFSMTMLLKSDGSDTGTATAQTVNSQGVASNVAMYYVNAS